MSQHVVFKSHPAHSHGPSFNTFGAFYLIILILQQHHNGSPRGTRDNATQNSNGSGSPFLVPEKWRMSSILNSSLLERETATYNKLVSISLCANPFVVSFLLVRKRERDVDRHSDLIFQ